MPGCHTRNFIPRGGINFGVLTYLGILPYTMLLMSSEISYQDEKGSKATLELRP